MKAGQVRGLTLDQLNDELVKLKVAGDAEVEPSDIAPEIERATGSQVAQLIGHTLVLYRRREQEPKIVLPRPKKVE